MTMAASPASHASSMPCGAMATRSSFPPTSNCDEGRSAPAKNKEVVVERRPSPQRHDLFGEFAIAKRLGQFIARWENQSLGTQPPRHARQALLQIRHAVAPRVVAKRIADDG